MRLIFIQEYGFMSNFGVALRNTTCEGSEQRKKLFDAQTYHNLLDIKYVQDSSE